MQSNNDITCTRQVHRSDVSCVVSFAAIALLFVRDARRGCATPISHVPIVPVLRESRAVHIFFVKRFSFINFPRIYFIKKCF